MQGKNNRNYEKNNRKFGSHKLISNIVGNKNSIIYCKYRLIEGVSMVKIYLY